MWCIPVVPVMMPHTKYLLNTIYVPSTVLGAAETIKKRFLTPLGKPVQHLSYSSLFPSQSLMLFTVLSVISDIRGKIIRRENMNCQMRMKL